jgi:hypothetical protein
MKSAIVKMTIRNSNVPGLCSSAYKLLVRAGKYHDANVMLDSVLTASSYNDAVRVISKYVVIDNGREKDTSCAS